MQGTLSLPLNPSFSPKITVRAAVAEVSHPSSSPAAGKRSLYEVLRIRRNATHVEIKTAYRTLAKLYHPDSTSRFMDSSAAAAASSCSSSDGRDFIEIHKAYATLSDPDARAVYDLKLKPNSQRRVDTIGLSGYRREIFYSTRRWETDQCW